MNADILTIIDSIEREKGIAKEVLFEAIEAALLSAARKILGKDRTDITVTIDKKTGEIKVTGGKKEIDSGEFGRIAAQTAKQVIIQKIREAERDVIFDDYTKRVGSIVSGSVHRFERGNLVVDLGKTEAILPRSQQCPNERYKQGDRIRTYLLEVTKTSHGPQIVLSRSDAGFVKKLFELEVPEITQGIVEIKSIARESGERTKIAVFSKDEKIDPVGACVGMRGSRVRDIVKELNGERIDIVRWDNDIRAYLPAAVSPAEIMKMIIDRENGTIKLTVPRDQLSLLIGKKGRNIRLASKLLGWELLAEAARDQIGAILSDVKEITKKSREALIEYGYDSINKVLELGEDGLREIEGIGDKTAQKIYAACETLYKEIVERRDKELAEAKLQEEASKTENILNINPEEKDKEDKKAVSDEKEAEEAPEEDTSDEDKGEEQEEAQTENEDESLNEEEKE